MLQVEAFGSMALICNQKIQPFIVPYLFLIEIQKTLIVQVFYTMYYAGFRGLKDEETRNFVSKIS